MIININCAITFLCICTKRSVGRVKLLIAAVQQYSNFHLTRLAAKPRYKCQVVMVPFQVDVREMFWLFCICSTQDLALQQILSSIDLFLSYRTDYTDSRTI